MDPAGVVKARQIYPRSQSRSLLVPCVPVNLVNAGGLDLVHQRPHRLAQDISPLNPFISITRISASEPSKSALWILVALAQYIFPLSASRVIFSAPTPSRRSSTLEPQPGLVVCPGRGQVTPLGPLPFPFSRAAMLACPLLRAQARGVAQGWSSDSAVAAPRDSR